MAETQGQTFHFTFLKIHGALGQIARQARTSMYDENIDIGDKK